MIKGSTWFYSPLTGSEAMASPIQAGDDALRVSVLSEALPYIQRFSGRRIVIKYGGAAMAHAELREAVFRDLALLAAVHVADERLIAARGVAAVVALVAVDLGGVE